MDAHGLDVDHQTDDGTSTSYGCSLDVWSYGAVVYEVLTGSTLVRRARNGSLMAKSVADVIGACPTQGPGAPDYARREVWKSLVAAGKSDLSRRLPEDGAQWDVVRKSLRWDPSARESMSTLNESAWFREGDAALPEPATSQQPGALTAPSDASSLSTASVRERVEAWLKPEPSRQPPTTERCLDARGSSPGKMCGPRASSSASSCLLVPAPSRLRHPR